MTFNQQHESFLSAASGHAAAINTWPCGQRGAGSARGIRRCCHCVVVKLEGGRVGGMI